ncbi:hypothetical protein F5Y17DRAFT_453631 [Xylariaceae sp. FL0594]|nr:hypothetical protein F5Y17DRAFT_453631 [Xylariaceae sp. FL0594]
MEKSDKTLEDLTDKGFPKDHHSDDEYEFPPIEELWAKIRKEREQNQQRSTSPTVMNSPTRYQEYLSQEEIPHTSDPIQTISQQSCSRAGDRSQKSQKRRGKKKKITSGQALRRSERIKALKGKTD